MQREGELEDSDHWHALDKLPPASAGTEGSPMIDLCVQFYDSQLQQAAKISSPYSGWYVSVNSSCFDGHMDVRVVYQYLVNQVAAGSRCLGWRLELIRSLWGGKR